MDEDLQLHWLLLFLLPWERVELGSQQAAGGCSAGSWKAIGVGRAGTAVAGSRAGCHLSWRHYVLHGGLGHFCSCVAAPHLEPLAAQHSALRLAERETNKEISKGKTPDFMFPCKWEGWAITYYPWGHSRGASMTCSQRSKLSLQGHQCDLRLHTKTRQTVDNCGKHWASSHGLHLLPMAIICQRS